MRWGAAVAWGALAPPTLFLPFLLRLLVASGLAGARGALSVEAVVDDAAAVTGAVVFATDKEGVVAAERCAIFGSDAITASAGVIIAEVTGVAEADAVAGTGSGAVGAVAIANDSTAGLVRAGVVVDVVGDAAAIVEPWPVSSGGFSEALIVKVALVYTDFK